MSAAVPTLAVPAPLYDEALAFCNARLAEQGKPAIDALPAGKRRNAFECPCGTACGEDRRIAVRAFEWERRTYHATGELWLVEEIREGHPGGFVSYFDTHVEDDDTRVLPIRDESLPVPS